MVMGSTIKCLAGQKFGYLVAKYPIRKQQGSQIRTFWVCDCLSDLDHCLGTAEILGCHLTSGRSRSCGCLHFKHGMSNTRTWQSWSNMNQRCNNKNDAKHYKDYGGRGISICERWQGDDGFINFLNDMGEAPEGMTIDRKDNDGNYEPLNCRWATITQQNRNRQNTLGKENVIKIRKMLKEGKSSASIAQIFDVYSTTILRIKWGKTWKGVE